jgi:hypothetical protein
MILSTHAIVGAAIASFLPSNPTIAFVLGFGSHFVLDAIPHWDYPIRSASMNPEIAGSMKYDRALFADMVTIGADALLGIVLALILFATQRIIILVLLGACAGILPDALQFAYMRFPRQPLASLQRFHQWSHTSHKLSNPLLGVLSQSTFVVAFVMIVRALIP